MAEAIYKSGQGYWTRMISAAGFGLLVAMGTFWIWSKFGSGGSSVTTKYIAGACALVFLAGTGSLIFWALGRNHRTVDFLVATEGEMKKVNWSTRREIMNSTGVVIFTMFAIAIFCFACDQLYAWFFQQIGVLVRPS
ncbi:MAG: preprotein translocase subunit SecE [Phycisphaerales bacterium]